MIKKTKLTLNICIIALVLGVGAQFYTNYKIDQTLKQFPYHFKDHFTIQVIETNSDFFTRDLTFGIKYKDREKHTDFIHTRLTALPFVINAESDIPAALIKDVNNALNITIDKNTIRSQFSVFGENLQSDILTQFRDSTNTQQTLETDLTYSPKTGYLELQTSLSGLNNENAKIKGLSGEFLLKPVGESYYDMIKADVNIADIDILLLDGDNTRIELAKTNYRLNKYIDPTGYDLTTRFYSELIKLSDKNSPAGQENAKAEGVQISTKQLAVPSHVTFYDQLHDLTADNINLRDISRQITDSLFNNDSFETRINIKNMTIPKGDRHLFNVKNAVLNMAFDNKNKQDVAQQTRIGADELSFLAQDDTPVNMKGINWNYNVTHLNLLAHLDLLRKYLPEKIGAVEPPAKDTPDFLTDLRKITENYLTQTHSELTVKNISAPDYIRAENASFVYSEEPVQNTIKTATTLGLEKMALMREKAQFEQLRFALPLNLTAADKVYPAFLCTQNIYHLLCLTNLSAKTYGKLESDAFIHSIGEINTATVSVDMNTFPPTGKAQRIEGRLALKTVPQKKTEEYFSVFQTFNQAEINAGLTVPQALVSDMYAPEPDDSAKLKETSELWRTLKTILDPNQPLIRQALNDGQYRFDFQQKDGKYRLNGKDPEAEETPSAVPGETGDILPAGEALPQPPAQTKEKQPAADK